MLKIWDADNFRRTVAGLALIAAPLVLLAALLVHPGEGEGGFVQTIADNPGRVEVSNLLIIFSSVLFVPGLAGILGLIRERGVVLAHVGVGLALIGVVGHAVWAGFQIVLVGTIEGGVDQGRLRVRSRAHLPGKIPELREDLPLPPGNGPRVEWLQRFGHGARAGT
jgi:hypothetical protein